MFSEWLYSYKPRPWHFAAPILLVLMGWGIYRNNTRGIDTIFILCVFGVLAVLWGFWIMFAGSVRAWMEYYENKTGTAYAPDDMEARRARWARAILGGRALGRRGWVGGLTGLFTRDEFDRFYDELRKTGIIIYANKRNDANGYRVNGAGGWEAIRKIATVPGSKNPSPTAIMYPNLGEVEGTAHPPSQEAVGEGEG